MGVLARRGPGALLFLCLALLISPITAAITNRTIDDTFGDSVTAVRPAYLPADGTTWKNQLCIGCAINPDASKTFDNTYTAATYNKDIPVFSITMDFTGTAIYVFFVLANDQGDGITTFTTSNFSVDGGAPALFTHVPDQTTTAFQFNQLVFAQTNLANVKHRLVISTSGITDDVYVNFDYAMYTFDDTPLTTSSSATLPSSSSSSSSLSSSSQPTSSNPSQVITTSGDGSKKPETTGSSSLPVKTSSSSDIIRTSTPVGAIVGGLLGGLALLILLLALLFCYRRRRRRQRYGQDGALPEVDPFQPQPNGVRPFMAEPVRGYHLQSIASNARPQGQSEKTYNPYNPISSSSQYSFGMSQQQQQQHPFPPAPMSVSDNNDAYGGISTYGGPTESGGAGSPTNAPIQQHPNGPRVVLRSITQGDHLSAPNDSAYGSDIAYTSSTPTTAAATREDLRRQRQQELDEQMHNVQQEIAFLTSDLTDQKPGRHASVRRRRTVDRSAPPQADSGQIDEEGEEMTMEEMREQLNTMREQITHLKDQQRSAWALGLSDDPPPGYSPATSTGATAGSRGVSMRHSTNEHVPDVPPPLPQKTLAGGSF